VSIKRNFLCVREVGSWVERYLSDEAAVPTGREHSTERGVWEVCVEAGVPRSNYVSLASVYQTTSKKKAYECKKRGLSRTTRTKQEDRGQGGESAGSKDHRV
jgi:hypothetical protein